MIIPDSSIEFDPLELRSLIEAHLGSALLEQDSEEMFDTAFSIPTPGIREATLTVHAPGEYTRVTLTIPLRDLRPPNRDWDMVSYPKPPKTPRPNKTELRDHGNDYEAYRNTVVEAVTTELGLETDWSLSDAVADGSEPVFTCREYETAHDNFGPDISHSAPYRCAFQTEAFWELSEVL